jgi:hypothetical protein
LVRGRGSDMNADLTTSVFLCSLTLLQYAEPGIMLKDTLYERFGLHSQNPYDQCKTLA